MYYPVFGCMAQFLNLVIALYSPEGNGFPQFYPEGNKDNLADIIKGKFCDFMIYSGVIFESIIK